MSDLQMIVSPVIDAVNDTTFWYTFIEKDIRGLMNWNMKFEWHEITPEERSRKPNIWAPHTNPIMSGGLFTINKEWFETLGYYDTGNYKKIARPLCHIPFSLTSSSL